MDSAVVLAVIGAMFELGGLSVVAWEIRNDREQAKRLFGTVKARLTPARRDGLRGPFGRHGEGDHRVDLRASADLTSRQPRGVGFATALAT